MIQMPRSCGCTSAACTCAVEDSSSVTWSGTGIASDPLTATPAPMLVVDDTPTLALDLAVAGDEAILTAQAILQGSVAIFTADGIWTKPVGVSFARVMMVGGGGGGASGQAANASPVRGGGAGDAGQVAIFTLTAADIPASAAVVVGQGGAGGAAVDGNDVGLPGTAGGSTTFGTQLVRGGAGGAILGGVPTHLAAGMPPGQFAVAWDEEFTAAHYYLAPGAGGVGEGSLNDPSPGGYSHPGQGSRFPNNTGGGSAGGGNGRDELVNKMGGGGGGGAMEEPGGDGGLYGGGGGGGGATSAPSSSASSGAGGNGADGVLVVIAW